MLNAVKTYSQQSFDLYGNLSNTGNHSFRLNSFEANPANSISVKDWEMSFVYSGIVDSESGFANDIFLVSLGKRLSDHYLYFRYTPGFKKEFVASTVSTITSGDESKTDILKTYISYDERFGLGYSYNFLPEFTAGLSLRFFQQNFSEDNVEFVYGDSTANTYTTNRDKNFWRADVGLKYSPADDLSLGISSANLILLNENGSFNDNSDLELRTDKLLIASLDYSPYKLLNLGMNYESNGSFSSRVSIVSDIWGGKVTAGISAHHDKYQNPFISSVMPSISFSSRLFNISIVGLKYLSERNGNNTIYELADNGIYNILNNQYSNDKIFLNVNFALTFTEEKFVKFIDVDIIKDIYPAMAGEYLNFPFAVAKITNLSDHTVNVKPSSFIDEINSEIIYSPIVSITPGDTADVPYFTIINEGKSIDADHKIAQANFYASTINTEPDDEMSKPLLVNDMNSWDGSIGTLKYFARKDYQYSNKFAKGILSNYKSVLDSTDERLTEFKKISLLFNAFVQNMVYVSDPRSSIEYVQFPKETIERKGGDCDDLSVSFSALLESIGIQTAFVDYKEPDGISHVNLLIKTGLKAGQASLITNNDKKYFVRTNSKSESYVWIPLETTSLTDFKTAWAVGSDKFYKTAIQDLGLVKGSVEIIDNY